MSWDADLIDDRGHEEGSWNYTHNCNRMIEAALGSSVETTPAPSADGDMGHRSWWYLLNGLDGAKGAVLLDGIIRALEAEPAKYREMNPPNGWGDYDSLLRVLREMRGAVPEWPCRWEVSG